MKTVYRKDQPHLFDVPIDEIQTALDNECSWLNTIFGRCERLVKEINGNKYYTANWYKAKNDYIQIAPDEGLGNFCFFVLDEPTDLENYFAGDVTRSTIGFSLIVWCDLRTIGEGRDTEAVKEELLQILNGRTHLRSGRMTIDKVYERAENVFREFDYDENDNQYLMHPFAGFRIEGELIVDTLCDSYIPPTPPTPVDNPYIKGYMNQPGGTFTFTMNGQTITVLVDGDGEWIYYPSTQIATLVFTDSQPIENVILYKIDGVSEMFVDYPIGVTCIKCDEITESAIEYVYHIRGNANGNFNFTLIYIDKNYVQTTVTETAAIDENGKWDVVYTRKNIFSLANTFASNAQIKTIEFTEPLDKLTSMYYAFRSSLIESITFQKNSTLPEVTTLNRAFAVCSQLKQVKNTNKFLLPKCTSTNRLFDTDRNLETDLDFRSVVFGALRDTEAMFYNCDKVKTLRLDNANFTTVTTGGGYYDFRMTSLDTLILKNYSSYKINVSFSGSPLTYESMLSVAHWLADLSGGIVRTVTFRKANFDALTAEQQSTLDSIIVTQKGWNLATA